MDESQYRSFTTNTGEKLQMEKMNKATRPGYLLEGWFTTDGIRWEEEFGTSEKYGEKNDEGVPYVSSMEEGYYDYYTITLTAHWKPREIPVTYGGAAAENKTSLGKIVELPASASSAGKRRLSSWKDKTGAFHAPGEHFLFDDWILTENNELPFTAVYEEIPEYGVIFDSNGGSYVPTEIVAEGGSVSRPQDPTRAGYLFAGWYLNDQEVTFPIRDIRSAVTLTAKWNRRTFTIVFDTNGGEEIIPLILKYEDAVSVPDPVRKGYRFEKWSPELPEVMPAYDLKVEAIWSPVPEPTVTPTLTETPVPDISVTVTPTPTETPVPDVTVTVTLTPTETPEPDVTPADEPDPTDEPEPSGSPAPSVTPEVTETPSGTPVPTLTQSGGSGGYSGGGYYSGNSAEYHSDEQPQKPDADTGDHTNTAFWIMLLAASMLLSLAAGFIFKKTINK